MLGLELSITKKYAWLPASSKSFEIGPTKNPGLSLSRFEKSTSATSVAFRLSYAGSADCGSPVTSFNAISPSIISSSNPVTITLFKEGVFQFAFNMVMEEVLKLTSSKSPDIDNGIVTSAEKRGRVVKLNSTINEFPDSSVELSDFLLVETNAVELSGNTVNSIPTPSRSWFIIATSSIVVGSIAL